MDTSLSYVNRDAAFFSSDEQKWITQIRKIKEQYPDEVEIVKQPEENDGCIYAKIPVSWFKIKPKRKVDLTEEEREVLRERMLKNRKDRTKK